MPASRTKWQNISNHIYKTLQSTERIVEDYLPVVYLGGQLSELNSFLAKEQGYESSANVTELNYKTERMNG